MRNIVMILGVWYPEPIVSAQVWTDIAVSLESNPDINQKIYVPKPSRPLGYDFENRSRNYLNIRPHIINSYISKSSSMFDRLLESLSFSILCGLKLLPKKNIDLIINNSWWLPGRYLIALICRLKKIKYITSVQDIYPESLSSKIGFGFAYNTLKYIDSYTLKNAHRIITIDQKMALYLSKSRNIDINNIIPIKNWTYSYEYYNQKGKKNVYRHTDFLFLGNLGKASGLDYFLNKMPINWKYSIKIGGSGTEFNRLKKIIQNRELKNVSIMPVQDDDTISFMKSADYALLVIDSSITISSVPSKYLAYIKNKLPVLCVGNKNSIIAEEIRKNKTGVVVNVEELFNSNHFFTELKNTKVNENENFQKLKNKYLKIICK